MTNKIKIILAVIILVAAFILGGVLGWYIKPGARVMPVAEPTVKVNPTPKEVKKADAAVKVVSKGHLSGAKQLPTAAATVKDKPPDPVILGPVTVPVGGTITARYTDAKTGAVIGEDTRQLTGETTVQVTDDQLKVDTKFEDEVTFAVDLPEAEPVRWHVGLYYSDGGWTGYLQRDWRLFRTKKADWLVWARGELEAYGDADRRIMAGVERRW